MPGGPHGAGQSIREKNMFKAGLRVLAQRSLTSAGLALATMTVYAADDPTSAWYVGTFSGSVVDAGSTTRIALDCRSARDCKVEMTTTTADHTAPSSHRPDMGGPQPMSAQIPNSDLQGARAAVKEQPDLLRDPRFGQLLTRLQPLLKSNDKLSACVDLSADASQTMGVCSVSSDTAARQSLVMVLATMNGSCGDLPFCAYYLVPLERRGSGG